MDIFDIEPTLPNVPADCGPGKQQVGEVQGDTLVGDEMVQAFKAALSRAQLPGKPRTYFLKDSELPSILREVLAARQPGADEPVSPMAKMAAALREKAAIEHTEYSQRVQSGEWGPMPEAGTQADFCRYCEGSGWDGESRKTKCPACSGTGIPVPPAPGIDLEQFREAVEHWKRDLHDDYKGGHIHDGGEAMRKAEHLLALIDASPKVGNTDAQDAARYRWLRADTAISAVPRAWKSDEGAYPVHPLHLEALDEAIDSAMQATSAEVGA